MFMGPGQDRVHALIDEMGIATYAAYAEGDSLLVTDDGELRRARGARRPQAAGGSGIAPAGGFRLDAVA
jgi:hypothetical protein